jgi:hypothetical protein
MDTTAWGQDADRDNGPALQWASPRDDDDEPLWPIIWTAGGLCWLAMMITGVLWALPISGRWLDGDYVVTSGARALLYVLLFLCSACAYRLGLGLAWPTNPVGRLRVIAVHVLLALVVVRMAPLILLAAAGLVEGNWASLSQGLAQWLPFRPTLMDEAGLLRLWMPPYVLGLAVVALVRIARQYHRESTRLAYLSTEYSNLRLAMLSAQLQPHFLFNSLHAISELIAENPPQAVTMLARLGEFLRYALESSKRSWIRVADEMTGVDAYLAVQQTRFRDRLHVQVAIQPEALAIAMPALLLQPIVENAIEHGRCGPDMAVNIGVSVQLVADRLVIQVTNSTPQLPGMLPRSAYGNGLANVEARLHAAYGLAASVTVGPDAQRGTKAELSMPARGQPLSVATRQLP